MDSCSIDRILVEYMIESPRILRPEVAHPVDDEFGGRDMYNQVEWMVGADMAILRLLAAPKPLALSPGNIAHNTGFSRSHISRRCRTLTKHGLLAVEENGDPFFSITELGQRVVDQEVTPAELATNDE